MDFQNLSWDKIELALKPRVRLGASWLDEKSGTWYSKVSASSILSDDDALSVLGQAFGSHIRYCLAHGLSLRFQVEHGFILDGGFVGDVSEDIPMADSILSGLWGLEIGLRRTFYGKMSKQEGKHVKSERWRA